MWCVTGAGGPCARRIVSAAVDEEVDAEGVHVLAVDEAVAVEVGEGGAGQELGGVEVDVLAVDETVAVEVGRAAGRRVGQAHDRGVVTGGAGGGGGRGRSAGGLVVGVGAVGV